MLKLLYEDVAVMKIVTKTDLVMRRGLVQKTGLPFLPLRKKKELINRVVSTFLFLGLQDICVDIFVAFGRQNCIVPIPP